MPQSLRKAISRPKHRTIRLPETTPDERGYTSKWRKASRDYRRAHPFCAMCFEKGHLKLCVANRTGVVDHKIPVNDGGPMWDRTNWWVLCESHHNGWKSQLERYARQMGQVGELKRWCDDPAVRPKLRGEI
jgi:5-methylcytosine-specific restriction endonuclease McrA